MTFDFAWHWDVILRTIIIQWHLLHNLSLFENHLGIISPSLHDLWLIFSHNANIWNPEEWGSDLERHLNQLYMITFLVIDLHELVQVITRWVSDFVQCLNRLHIDLHFCSIIHVNWGTWWSAMTSLSLCGWFREIFNQNLTGSFYVWLIYI